MQHKAVYLLLCEFTLHVSGVNHTYNQELQLPLSNVATFEGGNCKTPDDGCG